MPETRAHTSTMRTPARRSAQSKTKMCWWWISRPRKAPTRECRLPEHMRFGCPADWPPALVMVNGRTLNRTTQKNATGWRFDGNTLTTVIDVPSMPVDQPVTVRIARSTALFSRRRELDGFAGAMTRLREAYDALNQTWPIAWSPDELIDAMQTGDRLGYFPQQAGEQLAHYREVLPKAMAKVKELEKPPSQADIEELAKRFKVDPKSDLVKKKVADFKDRVARAEAALADMPNPQWNGHAQIISRVLLAIRHAGREARKVPTSCSRRPAPNVITFEDWCCQSI